KGLCLRLYVSEDRAKVDRVGDDVAEFHVNSLSCAWACSMRRRASSEAASIRARAISTYSGLISQSTASRPACVATSPVVPAPPNGSNTVPPSGQPARMHGLMRSGGKVAKWAPLKGRVGTVQTL